VARRRALTKVEALAMPDVQRVREALSRGGYFRCRLRMFGSGVGMTPEMVLTARYRPCSGRLIVLRTTLRLFPADHLSKFEAVDSRNGRTGPIRTYTWYGRRLRRLLEFVGWTTGNPTLDERLEKYRRWREYRRRAWEPWGGDAMFDHGRRGKVEKRGHGSSTLR